jgi:1-acyl-sn-glycerol-3-phosphate acyltransferase
MSNQEQLPKQALESNEEIQAKVLPLLKRSERWIYKIQERINRDPSRTSFGMIVTKLFGEPFVRFLTKHRWHINHIEKLTSVKPQSGVLVISNHRSFFDMFYIMTMIRNITTFGNPCSFAVRSPFFYDHPLGLIINFMMAGSCMWPPIFRDERRHILNPLMLKQVSRLIGEKKVSFGLHPEGARQKNMNPFELAKPRKGVGQIIADAPDDVVIIPMFLHGLTNSIGHELKQKFAKVDYDSQVHFYVGDAMLAKDLKHLPAEEISVFIMSKIQNLADEAKEVYLQKHPEQVGQILNHKSI